MIDEFQDLSGYDLDLLDVLFNSSSIKITLVEDPRQTTFSANNLVKYETAEINTTPPQNNYNITTRRFRIFLVLRII